MKLFSASLVAAVVIAAATSSPVLSAEVHENIQLGSGTSCLPNAVRCKKAYRPSHPRCFTVAVRENGAVRKKRVCQYSH